MEVFFKLLLSSSSLYLDSIITVKKQDQVEGTITEKKQKVVPEIKETVTAQINLDSSWEWQSNQ